MIARPPPNVERIHAVNASEVPSTDKVEAVRRLTLALLAFARNASEVEDLREIEWGGMLDTDGVCLPLHARIAALHNDA